MAFHWLNCDSFSLAGLCLGREKTFLPPAGIGRYGLLPVGNVKD